MKPEVQLFLAQVSGRVPEPAEINEQQSEAFLALCRNHRVDAYLGHQLQANACEAVAPAIAQKLLGALHGSKLRSRVMQQQLMPVMDELRRVRLPFAVLKGADLARRLYRDPGLRPFEDVDLLVPRGAASQVIDALLHAGFAPPAQLLPTPWVRKFHFHLPLVHMEEGWMLEVHWRLMDRSILPNLQEEDLWNAMRTAPDGYRILSPQHYIAYLAAHAAKHGVLNRRIAAHARRAEFLAHPYSQIRMIWLIDIAQMIKNEGVGARDVLDIAATWGCRDEVSDVLRFCNELFPSICHVDEPVPANRREGLLERGAKRGLMRKMERDLDGKAPCSNLLPWILVPSKRFHVRPIRLLTGSP